MKRQRLLASHVVDDGVALAQARREDQQTNRRLDDLLERETEGIMKLKTSPNRRVPESTELVIQVRGQHATVTASDGIIPQVIRDAVTAHRVHPQIAAGGITLQYEQVSYQEETHGFTIPTPFVPRVAAAGVTAGATVTISRGMRRRIERLSGVVERRGAARYAWNHALLEFCDSAPRGQVLVDNFGQAIESSARLLKANPDANWLLVVANDELVRGCNDFLAKRLGPWPRIGPDIFRRRPYQVIVAAKDAPLEAAEQNFDQILVIESRCLITDSTREFHNLIRCPLQLYRLRSERPSAASELLLECLAGPVVGAFRLTSNESTTVLRLPISADEVLAEKSPEAIPRLRAYLDDLATVLLDCKLPEMLTQDLSIVVGTEPLAQRYREQQETLVAHLPHKTKISIRKLDELVLGGVPAGVVVFWQATADWLARPDEIRLIGPGLRVLVDPFSTPTTRVRLRQFTTIEIDHRNQSVERKQPRSTQV